MIQLCMDRFDTRKEKQVKEEEQNFVSLVLEKIEFEKFVVYV